ncbi:MAG: 2OG-Fe(II) oxygenase family protein [Anderseniella sp.]
MKQKIEQAAQLFQAGQPREALEMLQPVTSEAPGLMRGQTLSARCWLALGHRDKALDHLATVAGYVDSAPRPALARANLAQFYALADEWDTATSILEVAVSLEPDNVELKVKHADMLANAGQWREALMIFEAAVKKFPENGSLLRSTAISAQMCNQSVRAVELYTRAMAAGLADKQVYSNLIGALIELGRIDEAHRHAVNWCAAMPADIEAMAFMALLEVEVGNTDAAARWFDFGRFVKGHTIEVPEGYDDLDAFNKALEAVVLGHNRLETPPEDHPTWHHPALRIGPDINNDHSGPVGELEKQMRIAVDRYFAESPNDDDHPFLVTEPKDYDIVAWSAVLDGEGNQKPHIHMSGYLSGCYYVTIPDEVSGSGDDNAGAFEMGRPPEELPFKAAFPVETVKPQEGLMLLFPAFMYHGTVPFKSKQKRICVAFDVIPRAAA